MKIEFKEMIDDMPNEEFLALSCILMTYMHDLEDEYMERQTRKAYQELVLEENQREIVIDLKKDANSDLIINYLLKNT